MLTDMFTLQQVLLSFENTLRIEYTETDVARIIKTARQKLENAYQCRLDQPVYTVQAQNELVSENLNVFLQELAAVSYTHLEVAQATYAALQYWDVEKEQNAKDTCLYLARNLEALDILRDKSMVEACLLYTSSLSRHSRGQRWGCPLLQPCRA